MTRHDLDLFSLLSGLVLSAIALGALFDIGLGLGPWVWPVVLIAVGVVVLTSVISSSRAADGAPGTADEPGTTGDRSVGAPQDAAERAEAMAAARAEVSEADHTPERSMDDTTD